MDKIYRFSLELPKKVGDYLIFSLPQSNHYQEMSNLNWKNKIIKVNENKIGIITLNDVRKEIRLDFKTNLKSIRRNLNKNYKLNDYSKSVLKQNQQYLILNRFINGQDDLVNYLTKSRIKKEENLSNIISSLYQLTLDFLTYGKPTVGLYSYKQAVEERITDCGGFATFLISLLNAAGIPAHLVVGYLIKDNIKTKISTLFGFRVLDLGFLTIHAWLEVLLPDGSWFPLDPSIDWRRSRGLTKREGGFGFIPADRLVTSFGCDFKIKINNKDYQIDIFQQPIYL